jgi:hypothetical protein
MDEKFVQGVVGGVLNRHKNHTLDEKRIQTLMVEIAANIDLVSSVKGLAKDNPLSIEMWKGYAGKSEADEKDYVDYVSSVDGTKERLSKEYLEYWTCDYCNKNTHEIDYDYLSGTDHLECCLKAEELQEKSDKIMKTLDEKMKDFDLSKSESNENSKVDMGDK